MTKTAILDSPIVKSLLVLTMVVLAFAIACRSEEDPTSSTSETLVAVDEMRCPALEESPRLGDVPQGPPPALPNIFNGTAYVNGEPVPEGEQIYVKLVTSRSWPVDVGQNGKFRDIIHGPVSDKDQGIPFVFCLGDPDGVAVKAEEIIEFDGSEPFKITDVELNFPLLPSELESN